MRYLLLVVALVCCALSARSQQPARTVTHMVFDHVGKPALNVTVSISYAWNQELVLKQALTDAAGMVTWPDVPPVRAIVWGDTVPPGVLAADAVRVTTPLPPPPVGGNLFAKVVLPDPGVNPRDVLFFYMLPYMGWTESANGELLRDDPTKLANTISLQNGSGKPTCFAAMTTRPPYKIAIGPMLYTPYDDTGETRAMRFPLTWQSGITITGMFTTPDRTPLNGFNRLAVMPEMLSGVPDSLVQYWRTQRTERDRPPVTQLAMQPGGAFTLTVPAPGTYRFLVDLYNEQAPPQPELQLKVTPGMPAATVSLPKPMTSLPAGTAVWAHYRQTPTRPVRLTMTGTQGNTPLFAPYNNLLALWFHTAPNELYYWNAFDPAKMKQLTARTAVISWPDAPNARYMPTPSLAPLFPGVPPPGGAVAPSFATRSGMAAQDGRIAGGIPEYRELPLGNRFNQPAEFWPARYPLLFDTGMPYKQINGMLEMPEAGGTVNYQKPPDPPQLPREYVPTRPIALKFPEADYAALCQQGIQQVLFYTDVGKLDGHNPRFSSAIFTERNGTPTFPVEAKKLTVAWLGVGLIRNIELPSAGNDTQRMRAPAPAVTLPAWEPGPPVGGTVLTADGAPYADQLLRVYSAMDKAPWLHKYCELAVRTDARGHFTIKGVLPGTLMIYAGAETRGVSQPCWVREVPEDGLPEMTLRIAAQPFQVGVRRGNQYCVPVTWWIPDQGAPSIWQAPFTHDAPTSSGYMWATDGGEGVAQFLRYSPGQGIESANRRPRPLGLYLPFDSPMPIGGIKVTLIGQGKLAGISVPFRFITWYPSSLLGVLCAGIDDVPPGEYRVVAETTRGHAEATVTVSNDGGWVMLKYVPKTK